MELLRKKWHQLVVIGNGFDRECGLPSRFSDFASTRETMLESFLDSDDKAIVDNPSLLSKRWPHLTLWDILLANEQGLRWYDIEAAIGSWVVPEPEDEVNIILMNRLDLLRKAIEALSKDGGAIGGYFGPDAKPVEIGWGSDSMYHAAARSSSSTACSSLRSAQASPCRRASSGWTEWIAPTNVLAMDRVKGEFAAADGQGILHPDRVSRPYN